MFSEDDLRRALRDCIAPGLHRNVIEAQLVRSATLTRDVDAPGSGIRGVPDRFIARVTLTAPGAEEAAATQLRALVENRLLGMPQISRAEVTVLPPLFAILNTR